MFMGEYHHNIDDKGRLIIPSKFRETLGNEFIITRGIENCLFAYSKEDWEKIVNNISVASFMQGIPIGSKYYNNYCIITNDHNKEVVTTDSIYIIAEDNELHLATCKTLIDNEENVIAGYKNTDFERQTVVKTEGDEVYFYPHANERCYDCMVNIAETYDIDELIQGEITIFNAEEENYEKKNIKNSSLRKVYLTALAREKYDLYKTNAYFGI